ncbi:uncharacterized protein LOC131245612 [Magnolia sinica]|uniref:uncharacterized protein LOC131245612 n=1 Tax=Magnolia sinica TaxID=86752 RepID=UPI00265AB1A6|nr:uncharacterized protein LOC131245612 [Magnolia sinica]
MKGKPNMGQLTEGHGLHVCRQSTKITKSPRFQVKLSEQAAKLDSSIENHQEAASKVEVSGQDTESTEDNDLQELSAGAQNSSLSLFDSLYVVKSGSLPATCPSISGTLFSPIFEPNEAHCNPINDISAAVNKEHPGLYGATDDSDDGGNSSSSDYLTCNVSDVYISDTNVASLSFDEITGLDDMTTADLFPDYGYTNPDTIFDTAEGYMILPFLEEAVETSNFLDGESFEEAAMNSDNACLYLAMQQVKPSNEESGVSCDSGDPDEADGFDPHIFIRNLPDLSEVVPSLRPVLLPKESRKRKPITLVLDLDETLVHSMLDHCEDADFTFPVYFNMKEHTVFVRQRPYLQIFLERVAEMFEIIVFTASQSIYAEQLLNMLDPDKKLISRRLYRESCVFSDGIYMKDLTVLGLDLAKVAIIDNSPQVFRLQVNNGIPIKSWFDDPSDRALISLIPFLETLVDADDVRPVIAKQYGNKDERPIFPSPLKVRPNSPLRTDASTIK